MDYFGEIFRCCVRVKSKLVKSIWKTLLPVILTVLFLTIVFIMDGNVCVFKNLFGIPCPGCGMTRAYVSLFKFDIVKAFYYHPLFILPGIMAFIFLFKTEKNIAKVYKSNSIWTVILVIIMLTWVTRMVILFPENAPMNFNKNALLFKVIPIFLK